MEPEALIESAAPTTSVMYNSTYRHGVDDKRRVQIPAKWRPTQPNTELTLVLWSKEQNGPCIRVLPPETMADVARTVKSMNPADPNKGVLKRLIGGGSVQVEIDKAGRICLPANMVAAAGLGAEAVLVGLIDRFEIWSPERYDRVAAADQVLLPNALQIMD